VSRQVGSSLKRDMAQARFFAEADPSDASCGRLAQTSPVIPYFTAQYRDALQLCGKRVWLLATQVSGELDYGCLGEVTRGRFSRELHVHSTPDAADAVFWNGLQEFCGSQRITHLSLGTIGTSPQIPELGELIEDKQRYEYWVDLQAPDLKRIMRPEQRRIYNRAVDAGMTLRQASADDGLEMHGELASASLGRRRARGEPIPFFRNNPLPRALLESGAGRLYECVWKDAVVGSAIITLSERGAHGYSAGYANEGLKAGAGVFLNQTTFQLLKAEGKLLFNLGDAPPDSGLALFKKGVGGVVHQSRAACFHVGGKLHRTVLSLRNTLATALAGLRARVTPP
jgi:hypothetical protein